MKRFLGGIAAAGVLAASASAQTPPYVDPALRTISQPTFQARAADAARALPLRLDSTLVLGGVGIQVAEEPTIGVIVQLGGAVGVAELQSLGARIGSVRDGIATARVPVSAIQGLTTLQDVRVVEAAHPVSLSHDSSMKAIRVSELRQLAGSTWTGLTGTGVIVAMYDTGLDFRHEDFIAPDGTTRVLGLWDQTRTGTPPTGFVYGSYCSQDAIQQAIAGADACSQTDGNGHGTHTAGTAAGDGSAAGNGTAFQYPGVAPGAGLLIVKGGNATFSEDQILDGLRWLEAEGRRLNRPVVVNLSLGGQFGAHDGRRLYEQGIDALARPGFVVVTTSGNEGSNGNTRNLDGSPSSFSPVYIHASGFPAAGTTRDFTINIPQYLPIGGTCNDVIALSFWYEGADRLRVTILRPDGSSVASATGERKTDDAPTGSVLIDNSAAGPHPLNGDHEALILISDCSLSGAPPVPGTYTIRVSTLNANSGQPYHMWLYFNSIGGFGLARAGVGFDNRYVIASPGAARTTVTVGAFVSRVCWPSNIGSGSVCFVEVEETGDLARFSSAGPTRDERLKPEITAPGLAVVSSLSRDARPGSNRIVPDGVHWANQGTSMAAPHVTGAIALLMQSQPMLTSATVKTVFSQTAAHDAFTSRVYGDDIAARPENWWGYGKLDVLSAACEFGLGGGIGTLTLTPRTDTLPTGATVQMRACGSDGVIVFQSSRPEVAQVDASGLVTGLSLGSTQIVASNGTLADTADIAVVAPAIVALSGTSSAPDTPVLSNRNAGLSLLRLGLQVRGVEAMRIHSLTFVVAGADPGARLTVAHDLDRNGLRDERDRPLSAVQRGTNHDADTIRIDLSDLTIAAYDSVRLIVGLELSGGAPNASQFRVDLIANRTETTGVRSGAQNRVEAVGALITSAPVLTTVLAADAPFSLSENPVRGTRLILNFRERPTTAAIYTLTGRRVLDILPRLTNSGFFEWDLRNSEGTRVAPGVYLLVCSIAGTVIREKLFVIGSGTGGTP